MDWKSLCDKLGLNHARWQWRVLRWRKGWGDCIDGFRHKEDQAAVQANPVGWSLHKMTLQSPSPGRLATSIWWLEKVGPRSCFTPCGCSSNSPNLPGTESIVDAEERMAPARKAADATNEREEAPGDRQ